MAMARTLVVVPRSRRKAAKIRVQRRFAAALWRYLSERLWCERRGWVGYTEP
jgi:hypothetical protein